MLFGGAPDQAGKAAFELLRAELPCVEIAPTELTKGVMAVDLLRRTGLVRSNSDARRALQAGEIVVGGRRLADDSVVGDAHLLHGRFLLGAGARSATSSWWPPRAPTPT